MIPALKRLRAFLFALALLAATAVFTWSAPAAAHAAGCTPAQVAVLVDFSHWGSSQRVGCASWTSSLTGRSALNEAGFATTGTTRDGPGFVCRIDGLPSAGAPDHEPCANTPAATRYWSYWHADAGQSSWTYSTLGASSYHPHAGSVDAWTFGAGTAPPVSPSAVRPGAGAVPTSDPPTSSSAASAPSTSRSTRRPTASSGGQSPTARLTSGSTARSTAPSPARSAARSAASRAGDPPSASTAAAPATTIRSDAATAASTTARSTTTSGAPGSTATAASTAAVTGSSSGDVGATPAIVSNRSSVVAGPTKASGSPGPTIVGIGVVVALAAGGGFYAWRRRPPRAHAG